MEELIRPWGNRIIAAVYIFLSFLSFYCACYRLPVGVKYAVDCVVIGWGLLAFLIKPRFKMMKFVTGFGLVLFGSFLMIWLWSFVIWIIHFQSTDYIMRGSKNIIYMLLNIFYVSFAVYIFGKKAIYYTFYAMCLANAAVLLQVGMAFGFGTLFSQYITLITTFAGVTGPVIEEMEIHDMVFGWGPYILYFLLYRDGEYKLRRWICLALAVFFFTMSFKRIGVVALGAAIGVGLLYRILRNSNKRRMIGIFAVTAILAAFVYLILIRSGMFVQLADRYGINLMGRGTIFKSYDKFYEISPFFMGNGIRFIYHYGETHGTIETIHNVFLGQYIELGFFMWFVWMWYDLYFRVKWAAKRYSYQAVEFLFISCVYVFVTYITDNTYFHFPINVTYMMIALVCCYETGVKRHLIACDEGI